MDTPSSSPLRILSVMAIGSAMAVVPAFAAEGADQAPPAGSAAEAGTEKGEAGGLRGFFKGMFGGREEPEPAEAEPVRPEAEPPPPDAALPGREAENLSGIGARADKYVLVEDGVKFYEDGPLQTRPPDKILAKGAIVQLVTRRRGWSDVVLPSGEFGTVATETLRKAKASDFPVEEIVVKEPEESEGYVSRGRTIDDVPVVPLVAPDLPDLRESEDLEDFASPVLLPPLPTVPE